jgi:hypothetical protein
MSPQPGSTGSEEAIFAPDEAVFARRRKRPETLASAASAPLVKQRGSIMFALLNLLYRAYCRARLLEMRRQHLAG